MEINEIYDFFCVDCRKITRQKYKGIYTDGNHLYICKECGCENVEESIAEEMRKQYYGEFVGQN